MTRDQINLQKAKRLAQIAFCQAIAEFREEKHGNPQ